MIEHKINGEKVMFEVHDSVTSFSQNQWRRIVAVFVNGHVWQFKDWQEKMKTDKSSAGQDFVELFLRVRGYFLHFQDLAVPDQVTKWNVKTLTLHRNKRH